MKIPKNTLTTARKEVLRSYFVFVGYKNPHYIKSCRLNTKCVSVTNSPGAAPLASPR